MPQDIDFQKPYWQRDMVFGKSRGQRIASLVLSLVLFAFPVYLWWLLDNPHGAPIGELVFFTLFFEALGVLFLFIAGPNEIAFDVEHKTYRRTIGWPLRPRTSFGHIKDLWGIYVGQTQGSQNVTHDVGVSWWGHGKTMTLSRFNDAASAERFADEIMAKLELPRVVAPAYLRPPQ